MCSQLFLAQGLGMGIAVGAMYIPSLGIIAHYFQKRRSLALGLATTVSTQGAAIFPPSCRKELSLTLRHNDRDLE